MRRHPLIGQAYDVRTDDLGKGLPDETETVVPIGYDEYGNLRVDHYSDEVLPETGATRLWNEDEFTDRIEQNEFVKEVV